MTDGGQWRAPAVDGDALRWALMPGGGRWTPAMTYDPSKHHRRSIRLKGFDYTSAGAYFVTVVTRGRACVFGEVAGDEMRLSQSGEAAAACWLDLPRHFATVALDVWVVMPNHLHGIVVVNDRARAKHWPASPKAALRPAANASPYVPRG